MKSGSYCKDVVKKLTEENEAVWAAHTLASNLDIFDIVLAEVNNELLIQNCLSCYSVAFVAQPDLDSILSKFPIKDLVSAYKMLDKSQCKQQRL